MKTLKKLGFLLTLTALSSTSALYADYSCHHRHHHHSSKCGKHRPLKKKKVWELKGVGELHAQQIVEELNSTLIFLTDTETTHTEAIVKSYNDDIALRAAGLESVLVRAGAKVSGLRDATVNYTKAAQGLASGTGTKADLETAGEVVSLILSGASPSIDKEKIKLALKGFDQAVENIIAFDQAFNYTEARKLGNQAEESIVELVDYVLADVTGVKL